MEPVDLVERPLQLPYDTNRHPDHTMKQVVILAALLTSASAFAPASRYVLFLAMLVVVNVVVTVGNEAQLRKL